MRDARQPPNDCRVNNQADGNDEEDGAHVAFGAVAIQYAAQTEQRGGQCGPHHQINCVGKDAGQGQTRQVDDQTQRDADDQPVVEHRLDDLAGQGADRLAGVAHDLHRGDAEQVTEGRVN